MAKRFLFVATLGVLAMSSTMVVGLTGDLWGFVSDMLGSATGAVLGLVAALSLVRLLRSDT